MCMISVIMDYGKTVDPNKWNTQIWRDYQKLLDDTKKLDEKLGEPDCVDPEKEKWMKEVEERLQKLESEAFRRQ